MTHTKRPSRTRPRAGFTLIESVMSMLIVGLMLVAALNTIGASKLSQMRNAERLDGPMLAEQLMTEILAQAYEEPVDTPAFGLETGESGGGRALWDDVDDYDGWTGGPPESKDGTALPGYDGWERIAMVDWVKTADLKQKDINPTGVKRIRVNVSHNGRAVCSLVALRTEAWPDSSEDAEPALAVLLVVANAASPGSQDQARQALMEAWGYSVELIDDDESAATFDEAVGRNDVAYISATVASGTLHKKLVPATIGVVNENSDVAITMGYAIQFGTNAFDKIADVDNTHEITSHLGTGFQTILTLNQTLTGVTTSVAPGARVLANAWISGANYKPSLFIIEPGGDLTAGEKAAGRRVQLPWGLASFDVSGLTDKGRLIMQQSIEWAANVQNP